jgi:hypothetical protein
VKQQDKLDCGGLRLLNYLGVLNHGYFFYSWEPLMAAILRISGEVQQIFKGPDRKPS